MHLEHLHTSKLEPLAIVGIGCRYPGNIRSLQDLWNVVNNKVDAISDYPVTRIKNVDALVDSERGQDKIISKRGGFIQDAEYFDAGFFNISPLEAEKIDPAQRLLMEVTEEAIENAGLTHQQLAGSNTGVFVGNWTSDYEHRLRSARQDIDVYATTGSGRYALSGRLSYIYNLQGPSMTVDTACSSSIVALHVAAQSLRSGDCDMALVGASNTITDFFVSIGYSRSGLLSDYGQCRFGDAKSTGYVRSEGAAMMIVKRLSDALRDNDRIHAVVLATATNSDGQSHKNLFAPSAITQEVMIRKALRNADVNPADMVYVEAHGTGTKAGDPTEIASIWNAVSDDRTKEDIIYAGSVKTNFGHTEAAAGLAGMLKVITALQHKTIPPSLHFEQPNPKVHWDSIGLKIPTQPVPWPEDKPLIAGVNTFGITGSNGHAILTVVEEDTYVAHPVRTDIFVLPLTAKSEAALLATAAQWKSFIETTTHSLQDVCAMAALRRTHFPVRQVFMANSRQELLDELQDFIDSNQADSNKIFDTEDTVKTVFVFPGQGAQWIQMGRELFETEHVYASAMEEINSVYKQYTDWDLLEEINRPEDSSRLHEIDIVQPVLVAVEIALANLWMSKGILPDIVVGHSMGEVAAAYVAGVITLHEAAKIIITRSRLMKTVSGKGAMLATDLTVEEANDMLRGYEQQVSVAVLNSAHSTVLSGDLVIIEQLSERLESEGRFNRKVKVDVASHSPHMDELTAALHQALEALQPKSSDIQFYSTVTAAAADGTQLDADYWVNNLRQPVQFGKVIQEISKAHHVRYIEMSPHATLLHAIQENTAELENKTLVTGSFSRQQPEQQTFYRNYTSLFSANSPFDWRNIYPETGAFVDLPYYVWQKERYWLDIDVEQMVASSQSKVSSESTATIDKLLYEIVWDERKDLTVSGQKPSIAILSDGDRWTDILQKALQERGCAVTMVADAGELAASRPAIVIHAAIVPAETILYEEKCWHKIANIQAVLRTLSGRPQTRYIVLTQGAYTLLEKDEAQLQQAFFTGILRTLQYEYTDIHFRQIDVPSSTQDDIASLLASAVLADAQYTELAIRDAAVFAPKWKKATSPDIVKSVDGTATYLVTGGNSGLGWETVRWLVNKGAKQIAILSRSGLNDEALSQISQWEKDGADIRSYTGDVGDGQTIQNILHQIQLQQSAIKGVFHAAGILEDTLFENLTQEKWEKAIQAKSNGAWHLHTYFDTPTLDFFVVYSSVSGVLGSAGQSNYAAANTFLDALVHYRRNRGLEALSVNWGTVAQIGLAARQENRGNRLKDVGWTPLLPEQLSSYFDAIFLSDATQIAVADIQLDKWAAANPGIRKNYFYSNFFAPEKSEAVSAETGFPSLAAAQKFARERVKQTVSAITKIGISKIKEDDTFKTYGIDSLLALQIKNKLQQDLKLTLNVSVIWAYPTVAKLADHIAAMLPLQQQEKPQNTTTEDVVVKTSPAKPASSAVSIEEEVQALSLDDLLKQLEDKLKE